MGKPKDFRVPDDARWINLQGVAAQTYICGFCGDKVSSSVGFVVARSGTGRIGCIRICPGCNAPTFFLGALQFPTSSPGREVAGVPTTLEQMYDEARLSASTGAYTASVMACRKMLMNIAVENGAEPGKSFATYVDYLADKGYVPPNGEEWVDYIRKRGNEANHEIALMSEEDARALIVFLEMLLRFIYEFPQTIPKDEPGQ